MRTGNEVMSERARRAQRQPPVGVNMDKFAPDRQVSGRSLTGTSHSAWRPEHDLWPRSRAATLHCGRSLSRRRAEDTGRATVLPGRARGPRAGSPPLPGSFAMAHGFSAVAQLTAQAQRLAAAGCVCGGGGLHGAPRTQLQGVFTAPTLRLTSVSS